jgi:hypothetical protein
MLRLNTSVIGAPSRISCETTGQALRINIRAKSAMQKRWDLHDDNLLAVNVIPPRKKGTLASVQIDLRDDSTGAEKRITVAGCANIRWVMDFNVLADNWFAQTKDFTIHDDIEKMKRFVMQQKKHWRVTYMPPLPPEKPIMRKLASIRRYRLFLIRFHGGTIEVLGQRISLKAAN